jgi:hypothetical protein
MPNDDAARLVDALRSRGIHVIRAVTDRGFTGLAMTTYSAQEFLTAIAPGPIDGSDALSLRVIGRGQDLGPDDEPWRFDATPTVRDDESPVELRIYVHIPDMDLAETVRRLGG